MGFFLLQESQITNNDKHRVLQTVSNLPNEPPQSYIYHTLKMPHLKKYHGWCVFFYPVAFGYLNIQWCFFGYSWLTSPSLIGSTSPYPAVFSPSEVFHLTSKTEVLGAHSSWKVP